MELMELNVPEELKGELGLLKKMLEAKSRQDNRTDTSLDAIKAAVARPQLIELTPGDILVQKKHGPDFAYKWEDQPVVFVDYVDDWDTMPERRGRVEREDLIVAIGVDKRDGELTMVRVDSTFFDLKEEDGVAV